MNFEILISFLLAGIIVFGGIYMLMNRFFKQESERRAYEWRKQNNDIVLPIRLRAYERIVLFLSRIEPKSLLLRFDFAGMTVLQLQQMLLQAVRDEYDHNVSQQIYISREAWALVVNARESLTQLINTCASQLNAQADAMELANLVLAAYGSNVTSPIDLAIDYIKNRTHWIEQGVETLLAEQLIPSSGLTDQMQNHTAGANESFIITIDGIAYKCISWSYFGETYIGDSRIYDIVYDDGNDDRNNYHPEDVPFVIYHYSTPDDPMWGVEGEIYWDITFLRFLLGTYLGFISTC